MTENLELARHHFELALIALNQNNDVQAEIELRNALQHSPSRPSILANLSAVLIRQQKWIEAKKICANLLEIESNSLEGCINLGICEQHTDNLEAALRHFNRALEINPKSATALVNKGNILSEKEIFDAARTCFESALRLEPNSEEGHIGLGNLLNELKDYDLGLEHFSKTLSINPNNFQAQWNKSLSLLRLGQYEEGWRLYESRWQISGMAEHAKHQDIPLWLGESPLAGKTILIHAEQGFGDAIQMSRYLPILVNQMGARVIFEVNTALIDLMRPLDSKIKIINSNIPLSQQVSGRPDFQCPIMSLPFALRTTLDSIPNHTPYLYANPEKRDLWRKRLANISSRNRPFRIGITWSGSGHYAGKKNSKRDLPFDCVRSLVNDLSAHSIEFHAIQKEFKNDYLLKQPHNLFLHHDFLDNFADSAALIAELDLIVSIDTAVGHLAGALGQRTLLLIPDPPDFMAMRNINHSLWYPSVSLIRQESRGIWPLENIKSTILKTVKIGSI
ncbi:tetratricopeptide repeat protein [Polynucleobacter sp. AP-Titi-500A-B4]|uniref:tetratricopeptide repeat protein n=1 Tax=Polynucleobacter sp. AP-Titi-500A-B4 TaxID=2576923 RepID=UPI001BFCEE3D|nr:tetratricopeptide repeat protein [Polynucleobacter sp. AP-Titi-500A-B4]QWE12625.1 tetratricopeptide repeat protein [Polynucleobacter sp. AP-Titi-500A-B4]